LSTKPTKRGAYSSQQRAQAQSQRRREYHCKLLWGVLKTHQSAPTPCEPILLIPYVAQYFFRSQPVELGLSNALTSGREQPPNQRAHANKGRKNRIAQRKISSKNQKQKKQLRRPPDFSRLYVAKVILCDIVYFTHMLAATKEWSSPPPPQSNKTTVVYPSQTLRIIQLFVPLSTKE
jgi:hypothetical protein